MTAVGGRAVSARPGKGLQAPHLDVWPFLGAGENGHSHGARRSGRYSWVTKDPLRVPHDAPAPCTPAVPRCRPGRLVTRGGVRGLRAPRQHPLLYFPCLY